MSRETAPEIRSKAERRQYRDKPFAKDFTRDCEVCGMKPVVNATGLCGPCTWGESETANGNW